MCATTLSHGIFWAQLVSQPSASPPAFSWAPKPLISQRLAASLLAVPNLAAVTAVLMLSWCIYHYIYISTIFLYNCHWLSLIVILSTYIMHIHIPLYCSLFNHPSWYLLVVRIFRTNIASTRSQIELYCFGMLWSVLNIFKNLLYLIIPLLNHHGGISQQRPVGEWLVRLNFGTFHSLILTAELKVTPHRASTSNKICSTSQSRQWQVRGAEVARDSCDKIRFKG